MPHDHRLCIDEALARAEALCAARGARLTALRRRVLELVWTGHQPRGAYAILDDLGSEEGKATAPLTVYRALEFLVAQGLVHRIESLNAYVGCAAPGEPHSGQFLVCESCGNAVELNAPEISAAISDHAAGLGFEVRRQTVEVSGRCRDCRRLSPATPPPAAGRPD